jgi:vacuolar protein sorting-associated protein 54
LGLASSTNPNTLILDNEQFVLSNSILYLTLFILKYCSHVQSFPSSSINRVEYYLLESLNLFNSKIYQLVLGANEIKLGTVEKISIQNLAIKCRCLQFIKKFLPKIKSYFDQFKVKVFFFFKY